MSIKSGSGKQRVDEMKRKMREGTPKCREVAGKKYGGLIQQWTSRNFHAMGFRSPFEKSRPKRKRGARKDAEL